MVEMKRKEQMKMMEKVKNNFNNFILIAHIQTMLLSENGIGACSKHHS